MGTISSSSTKLYQTGRNVVHLLRQYSGRSWRPTCATVWKASSIRTAGKICIVVNLTGAVMIDMIELVQTMCGKKHPRTFPETVWHRIPQRRFEVVGRLIIKSWRIAQGTVIMCRWRLLWLSDEIMEFFCCFLLCCTFRFFFNFLEKNNFLCTFWRKWLIFG